eukprot:339723_1
MLIGIWDLIIGTFYWDAGLNSIAWNVGTVANQNALYSVLLLCCLWIGGLAHCCVGNWGYLSGHNVHIVARITSTVYITEALIQIYHRRKFDFLGSIAFSNIVQAIGIELMLYNCS